MRLSRKVSNSLKILSTSSWNGAKMRAILGILVFTLAVAINMSQVPGDIESGLLTDEERKTQLEPLLKKGWCKTTDRDAINKEFNFKSFNEAFGFMTRVAIEAEKIDHHPEWFNNEKLVNITMYSYALQGLTIYDIKLANFIESII